MGVCSYEKFGFCRIRDVCNLFHPTEDCKDVDCKILTCRKRHPQPCKFYGTPKGCSFGSSCKFTHLPTETCIDVNCNFVDCSKRHPEPCRFFGTTVGCTFGSSCIFDHRRPFIPTIKTEDNTPAPAPKRKKRRETCRTSSKVFNAPLPMELIKMIFEDQILDYEDILSCRLVSRGWRDIVQKLGLLKSAQLLITRENQDIRTRYIVEDCLGSNLFLSVGTLYISTEDDYEDEYDDEDEDDEFDRFDYYVTEMLTDLHQADNIAVKCLKLGGRPIEPDALVKAVCKIPTVELNELEWLGSHNLEQFLNEILNCKSLVLESFTLRTFLESSSFLGRPVDPLVQINPNLLGLVAVRMKEFKARVIVKIAEAILIVISECRDVKLQDLELDVWSLEHEENEEDIYDLCEEEIKIVKSKIKNFTIRTYEEDSLDEDQEEAPGVWTQSEFETGCDHDYIKPWCDSCQDIASEYGLDDWM